MARESYSDFLARKLPRASSSGVDCDASMLPSALFDYQAHCVDFAVRAHRCSFRRHDECGGTVAALAAAISTPALPVRANTISMWRLRRNVPSEYCPAIERETRRRGRPVDEATDAEGPRGTYGCACLDRDSVQCAAIRYGMDHYGEACTCLCHQWSDDDDEYH
ncbi:MAG: hypothetical protein AzoDbin1_05358 [Azoarcus sp.]|nr:hypothetical protein [Azoarcus sp.]